jgi:hypothetical protein
MTGFSCSTCGQWHTELPMCFGPSAPDLWFELPEAERATRAELSSDQCVIDGKHFFVLGRIVLPVRDGPEPFVWLAWVSLSEANFMRMAELWHTQGRESEPEYFGWLQNSLPYDVDTASLKTHLRTMPMGERPEIVLEPTDHPLALEQRDGITLARVREIVETVLHG